MDNAESEILRELREMRAEVRRLQRTVLFGFIGVAAVVVWLVPDAMFPIICAWGLLAFLSYPKSFMIFPSKQDRHKNDA